MVSGNNILDRANIIGDAGGHFSGVATSYEPKRLLFSLKGLSPSGPNDFIWENGLFICDWGKVITPSMGQWQDFWRVCETTNVWSWPQLSSSTSLKGGVHWDLQLETGDRWIASKGQTMNAPNGFHQKLILLNRTLQSMAGWHNPYTSD